MRNPTPEFPEFLKSFSEEELNNSQFTAIHHKCFAKSSSRSSRALIRRADPRQR